MNRPNFQILANISVTVVLLLIIFKVLPIVESAHAIVQRTGNTDIMLLPFGSSFGLSMTIMPSSHGTSSTGLENKYLVPIMKTSADQQRLLSIYKHVTDQGDKIIMKPDDSEMPYAAQLKPAAGNLGVEYFSLADIKANAPTLKSKGVTFISYDLENLLSPNADMANPAYSMQKAAEISHHYGLAFMADPSHILTDKYYTSFAKVSDMYNLQSEAFEPNPATYSKYVHDTITKLKDVHPGMPVSVETSTNQGTALTMERCFSLVSDVADGSTTWYSNDNAGYTELQQYLDWFVDHYG